MHLRAKDKVGVAIQKFSAPFLNPQLLFYRLHSLSKVGVLRTRIVSQARLSLETRTRRQSTSDKFSLARWVVAVRDSQAKFENQGIHFFIG